MSNCVRKEKCPDCDSPTGLQVYYNEEKKNFTGFCFSGCNEFKGVLYKDGNVPEFTPKTQEEIDQEIRDIQECKYFKSITKDKKHRGIPEEFFRSWGIRMLVSEHDGVTPNAVAFGYQKDKDLLGWKVATLKSKHFWAVGNTKNADPFGMQRALQIGGKRLYVTEGEWDAVALDYALVEANKGSKFSKKGYPVVSLSAGAGSIVENLKVIMKKSKGKFDEIVLVLDNDEPGLRAEKVAQRLNPDILVATKPAGCKDANDAVKKGLASTMAMARSAQWEAHKPPIEGIVRVKSVLARALEKPQMGLSYPWPYITEMTYGQRYGEAVCLGAGVGSGKTVTAHEMMAWNMVQHGQACFAILLEEQNHDTLKNVCGKADSMPYHNPKFEYDPKKLVSTAEGFEDLLFMWESEEDQALRFDMEEIITAIRFNAIEYGVKFVYLDNWTRLVDHLESGEANAFINKYSSEIENLATQLDIHIMTYSHLNTPKGPSHEEGAPVYASQFTGSRGIMRSFPMLMAFRRNKHADEDLGMSKNNSILSVIKNRKYGNEGEVKTAYSPKTGRLLETNWEGELMTPEKKSGR